MIPDAAVELERLVVARRVAAAELLNLEMHDRWGHSSDPVMNQKMEQAGAIREMHTSAGKQLVELVRSYRKEQPEAVEYWANAHVQLLQNFLETTTDSTARFVAEKEISAWQAVLSGNRDIVEENIFYVAYDAELHRKLFGAMLDAPEKK